MNAAVLNESYVVATAPDAVRMERLLPGPAERLWSYLVDADKRAQWFCGGDTLRSGAPMKLHFQHSNFADEPTPGKYKGMDDGGFVSMVTVTEFDPPRLLAYSWPNGEHESEVMFELFPEGKDVRLVLTHRRLKDGAEMRGISGGWHAHFDALAAVLAGSKPTGFWSTVARLETEYRRRLPA